MDCMNFVYLCNKIHQKVLFFRTCVKTQLTEKTVNHVKNTILEALIMIVYFMKNCQNIVLWKMINEMYK